MTTQTQVSGAALAAVRDLIEPWNRACIERDWDALLDMCTPDVVFLPPGSPPLSGAAIRPWLEAFPEVRDMWWEVTALEAEGDLACLWGPVKQTLIVDGEKQSMHAKFCDLARRGPDGRWRFAVIIWNDNDA